MKWLFGTLITLCLCASATAMSNEPTGFRGIEWGSPPNAIPGLIEVEVSKYWPLERKNFSQKTLNDASLFLNPAKHGVDYLKSYVLHDEKLEFGGVTLSRVAYVFFNNRLMAAVLFYYDHAGSDNIARAPHPNWNAKSRTNQALKKYFGDPSKEANALVRIFGSAQMDEKEWVGTVTSVQSQCTRDSMDQRGRALDPAPCVVIFRSRAIDGEYREYLTNMDQEKKAKADF